MKVVSTFSGCGGSSLGYKRAGYEVQLAIDFEENAVRTYADNFPETLVWQKNIRDITGKMILDELGIKKGELDLFDGSPPCTPFSSAGKRTKGWNTSYKHSSESTSQRADDLFFEYTRLIGELNPKAFVGENVRGLILGKARGYFNLILREMKSLGYEVKVFDVMAKDFEVPLTRLRQYCRCRFIPGTSSISKHAAFHVVFGHPISWLQILQKFLDGFPVCNCLGVINILLRILYSLDCIAKRNLWMCL